MRRSVSAELELMASQMLSSGIPIAEAVERFEAAYVRESVRHHGGNQCRAAIDLGIHRNTLSRILGRGKRWIAVYRLSTGRVWPREPVDEESQACLTESDIADRLSATTRR